MEERLRLMKLAIKSLTKEDLIGAADLIGWMSDWASYSLNGLNKPRPKPPRPVI